MASKFIALFAALLVACQHVPPAPPATVGQFRTAVEYTPENVVSGVYKLEVSIDGEKEWSGTGWKIDPDHMMTAGHVCDPDGNAGVLTIKAISRWNAEYPVKVVKFSRTPDLCLLDAANVPGFNFDNFVKVPTYGADVWYLGAPHGVWGDGTAPFAKGFYIGGKRMMIAGYPGASGSPVFTKDGVFGILVRGYRGTHLIEFETAADIALFLTEK